MTELNIKHTILGGGKHYAIALNTEDSITIEVIGGRSTTIEGRSLRISDKFKDGFLFDKYERGLIGQGEVIACVKSFRERTGLSLVEAKAHLDLYRKMEK